MSEAPSQVALVGRPNAGKSSLFNRLTGGSAHVGNFPGVTVDILTGEAALPGGKRVEIHDLPGLYLLESSSADERVTIEFLRAQAGRPLVIVNVVDGTQLGLHLRLTRQLQEAAPGARLLLAVTQADEIERSGQRLDVEALGERVGAKAVLIRATSDECRGAVLAGIEAALAGEASEAKAWSPAEVAGAVLTAATAESPQDRSERVDRVLLHPLLGPLLFVVIMGAMFAAVFLIADPASSLFDWALGALGKGLKPRLGEGLGASLLLDGVLGGVGTVLAFLPQIVVLIALLEVLEASGYLARAAFLVDRWFRAAGLGGKAFVPLLTAHACAVPAITATRVLRDPGERLATILVLPLMSCSARLPTYTLLVSAFFGGGAARKALICTGLYLAGAAAGLLASVVMRKTAVKGRALPLLLEMPSYKRPSARQIALRCGREAWDFTRRAGTVILAASVLLWALLRVPVGEARADVPEIERSAAAFVGKALEPVSRPIGFDWRINVGLIGAFGARELMVSTMGVIFGVENAADEPAPLAKKLQEARGPDGAPAYGAATAASLLAFFVLACQCISTLAAVRRETRSARMAGLVLIYTYALAYAVSFVVYHAVRQFT